MLKITNQQYSLDQKSGSLDHLEQIGSGDMGPTLVSLVRHSTSACLKTLSIHALFCWIQRWSRARQSLIELDMVPMLLETFTLNASKTHPADIESISGVCAILRYLIDDNDEYSSQYVEHMEQHNAAGKLLGLCCSPQLGSTQVCMALDLLKTLTKASPRIFESIVQQNGPSKVAKLLKTHEKHPDVVKYATLLLARWGAVPGMADRLESTGVFEALWDVIILRRGYDSKTYAYAACAICVLSVDHVKKLCSVLVDEGINGISAFCYAIEQYDACFEKHSVVHHIIWQSISSVYGESIVILAAKLGMLESLAKWETNCRLILQVIATLVESGKDFNGAEEMISSFLVRKMPQYPVETVGALFTNSGSETCLANKLVETSCQELLKEGEKRPDHSMENDDGCETMSDLSAPLMSEPSVDSLACLVEDNGTKEACVDLKNDSNSLGTACFEAFASKSVTLGSTVILCKVLEKLSKKLKPMKHKAMEEQHHREPVAKRFKSTSHNMVTFWIGEVSVLISREDIIRESRVASLFLEGCSSEITVPLLHHLSKEETVQAFQNIFNWCEHGYIADDMSLEQTKQCWIAADYLDMSGRFHNYLFSEKVQCMLGQMDREQRGKVYKWLSTLCRMFAGSESLCSWAARCMIYELGQCYISLDSMPNLESLKEFAQLHGICSAVTTQLRLGFVACH